MKHAPELGLKIKFADDNDRDNQWHSYQARAESAEMRLYLQRWLDVLRVSSGRAQFDSEDALQLLCSILFHPLDI
jgi:hypothetical protein